MEKLSKIKEALLEITDHVYHYKKNGNEDEKYFIWQEDSEVSNFSADNEKYIQTLQGTIDYFTTDEFDSNIKKLNDAMNNRKIPFKLNAVLYEEETNLIHYEWIFEV